MNFVAGGRATRAVRMVSAPRSSGHGLAREQVAVGEEDARDNPVEKVFRLLQRRAPAPEC
jgi:hypothetical protein